MPYCSLSLSCDLSNTQIDELMSDIDKVLKETAKKPPGSVMINIFPNCHLSLDGNKDAAFLQINAVGIDEMLMETLGTKLLDIISAIPGINRNRCFIHFTISDPVTWFLRGHTLRYWKEIWTAEGKKGFSE